MHVRPQFSPPAALMPILVGVAVALASAFSSGCGASALQTHARIAVMLHGANDAAVRAIETGCEHRAVAAARDPDVSYDEASANAQRVLARCQRVVDAQHAFSAAYEVYVAQLLAVVDDDNHQPSAFTRLRALLAGLAPLYADLAQVAADLGIHLPTVPFAPVGAP